MADSSASAPQTQTTTTTSGISQTASEKTLGTTANLMKLLPSGTVLAFQVLSPSFTNNGVCFVSNKYLTVILITSCTLSCCFFTFVDTFKGQNGKLYFGVATLKGIYLLNSDTSNDEERNIRSMDLSKYKLRGIDFVHAFFTCLVFLSLAFGDSDVQNCFFRGGGRDTKELLINLPLGVGFVSSLVFILFPTTRKGVGHSDTADLER